MLGAKLEPHAEDQPCEASGAGYGGFVLDCAMAERQRQSKALAVRALPMPASYSALVVYTWFYITTGRRTYKKQLEILNIQGTLPEILSI